MLQGLGLEMEQRCLLIQNNTPEFVFAYWGVHYLGAVTTMAVPFLQGDDIYRHFASYTRARVIVAPDYLVPTLRRILPSLPHVKAVLVTTTAAGDPQVADDPRARGNTTPAEASEVPLRHPFIALDDALTEASGTFRTCGTLCRDDIATFYFTGGTTGLPKGCVHRQGDLPYAAATYGRHVMQLTCEDITATVSPMIGPYACGSNLLFPWSVGAAVVVDNNQPSTPEGVFELLRRFRPTVLVSTPGMIRGMCDLAETDPAATDASDALSSLRYAISQCDSRVLLVTFVWRLSSGDVL